MKKSCPIGLFPLFTADIYDKEEYDFPFNKFKSQIIKAARDELTKRQWEIFRMHYLEEKTQKEIAFLIGVDKSAVCRQLKRSREKLNRVLKYSYFSQLVYAPQSRYIETLPKA